MMLYTQYIGTTMHTLHTPGKNIGNHNVHHASCKKVMIELMLMWHSVSA